MKGPINARIELDGERVTPALADAWDVVCKTAGSLLEELLQTHRDEILKCWVDSGGNEYALTNAISFKGAANAPLVKLKLSWTTKFSDEASEQVDDGTQGKLPLDEEDPEEAAEHRRRFNERKKNSVPLLTNVTPPEEPKEPLALPPIGGEIVEADFEMVEHPETPAEPEPGIEAEYVELVCKALEIIGGEESVFLSKLQRRLRIGYTKAANVVEILERLGVLVKSEGNSYTVTTLEKVSEVLASIASQKGE